MAVETQVRTTPKHRVRVRDRVFRPEPAPQPRWWVAVLAVLGVAALSLTRVPNGFDIVYAEDGSVFLTDALNKSPWAAIATPYSGYLHLAPRLCAEIVALFPVGAAPVVFAILGAVVTASLALFVYVASGAHLRSPLLRLAVAFPVALPMIAVGELPNSVTMLRWLFMYTTFWALLYTPRSRAGQVVAVVVVVLAAFTDNVVALYVPLAIARVWVRRDGQSWWSLGALLAGAAVNVGIVVTGASEHPTIAPRTNPIWAVEAYILRPVPQALMGEGWVGMNPAHNVVGLAPVGLAWLLVGAIVVLAWRRLTNPDWALALLAAAYSGAVFLFVVMVAGTATGRYSVPAAFLAVAALAFLLKPVRSVVPAAVFLAVLAMALATSFRLDSLRARGPHWSTELRAARAACAAAPDKAYADVLISPYELNWHARIPCARLR
jgi:hypothetical protein